MDCKFQPRLHLGKRFKFAPEMHSFPQDAYCLLQTSLSVGPPHFTCTSGLLCPSTVEALQCKVNLSQSQAAFPPVGRQLTSFLCVLPVRFLITIPAYIYIYGFLHYSHSLPHCSVPYFSHYNVSVEIVCISIELGFILSNGCIRLPWWLRQ